MDALAARFAPMTISDNSHHSCDKLCCSPVVHYEEMPFSKVLDLSTPIHPVFRPENFSPAIQYDIIAPVLRLATQFILSNSAVVYINTIFNGVVRDPSGAERKIPTYSEMKDHGGFWSIWPCQGMDGLTHDTKQNAMQILWHMTDMVTFSLGKFPNSSIKARCRPQRSIAQGSHVFPGVTSRIELLERDYEDLVWLTLEEKRNTEPTLTEVESCFSPSPQLVESRFSMARCIVHEVSHALTNAAHGVLPHELCSQSSVMAEAGSEFEMQVFGCLMSTFKGVTMPGTAPHASHYQLPFLPPMLLAMDWPSPWKAIGYRSVGKKLWNGGPIKRYELLRRVPWTFLLDLFTDSFWHAHHDRQDTLPIPVPTVGCCVWWASLSQPPVVG